MIDIIVPTYNSQKTINRCLGSILKIKRIDYDVILVDDGSSDYTPKINNLYAREYTNIYSIRQNNKGVSEARNTGIRHAKGDWICFIDSDDFINATIFTKLVKLYLSRKNDLIVSNISFNGKQIGVGKNISSNVHDFIKFNYPLYGNEMIHVVWNKIFKAAIVKNNDIKFPKRVEVGEDLIFVLKYLMFIHHNIIQTKLRYYNYYVHKGSITKKFERNPLYSRLMILKYLRKVFYKYKITFKSFNNLRIKAIYSILLNSLNGCNDKLGYLKKEKFNIINSVLYKNIHFNRNLIDDILIFFFRQPFILILFVFIILINIIRLL